jgi:L-ascorbate metabolism protein UlaG (beta-lactamase superfamily)
LKKRFPYREHNRFYNYPGEVVNHVFWRSLYMYLTSYAQRKAAKRLMKEHRVPYAFQETDHITWIGHASFLISIAGCSILTDPIFGDLTFLLQRSNEPGIAFEKLPHIDIVILSHNHRDHMDSATLSALFAKTNCHFYVPWGDKAWFDKRFGGDAALRVTECMWWQEVVHKDIKLTFLPAQHWSQRGFFDRNKSLWGSWMIQDTIYFAGDTAYTDHFKEIAEHFPAIEVALLPIGPCEPRAWMATTHMNAEDAGRAFFDLRARTFIPMHWGTYGFGIDDLMLPIVRLKRWWQEHALENKEQILSILAFGQSHFLRQLPFTGVPFIADKGNYAVR